MPGETGLHLDTSEVDTFLRAEAQRAPEMAAAIARQAGLVIVSDAEVEAPILTGFLRDSHGLVGDGFRDESPRGGSAPGAQGAANATELIEHRGGPGSVTLYVNAAYAAAVHERHPSKAGWFRRAIQRFGVDRLRAVAQRAFEQAPRPTATGGGPVSAPRRGGPARDANGRFIRRNP